MSFRQEALGVQYSCGDGDGGVGVAGAAVVAHPYAPLGGNFDDRVVVNVVKVLVQNGWVVGTFNFRYVSPSLHSRFFFIIIHIFPHLLNEKLGHIM